MTTLQVGDFVIYRRDDDKLKVKEIYRIESINRGLDGAYDWDDIFLEGVKGNFCEFDFEVVG